jgi:valyl-tRNA synthetase
MDNRYQPQQFEHIVSQLWQDVFVADNQSTKPSFVMMMPPPNITGRLHMGHALNNTLQDSIARYKRMSGYNVLWLPGTDHASIATELKVVELLKSQGISKQDLTREQFVAKCYEWKDEYGNSIVHQLKRLGCSVDWSRQAFTMDEQCSKAVKSVFVDLYNQGLIYKGNRIINWCVDCKTALSDAEVEYNDNEGCIWHIRYPIDDIAHIVVATTRPETLLGDTAIVVHPQDQRYTNLIGKHATVPLVNRKIPILADTYVDKDFGSGAVKVTPAHDPNDFEIGVRHSLESIKILTDDGHIARSGTPYDGLDRNIARNQIVLDLDKAGLLVKVDKHNNSRGHCYRCNSVVEPMVSQQWFVKMQPLATPAIDAVNDDQVQFVPKSYTKIYMHWMTNIKDWCISRQLWWGHRIPAWYCTQCCHMTVSTEQVDKCPKCSGQVLQDEGVLDTWFSSALWPFSTLGYPDKTVDLAKFYPGALLVTAYDIIFFWVARMVFGGLHHMGQVPFDKVLIHGIVRASDGRKMSKSLGNGVDPIEIIDNYGTDSLRFCLLSGVALGSDIRYSEERLHKAQAFCNKIYNAARFVQHNMQGVDIVDNVIKETLTLADKWILSRLSSTVDNLHSNFEQYELGRVADCLYDFVWDDFCDWYIEISKVQISQDKVRAVSVLVYVFGNLLKILHPIMPYITEYLYNKIYDQSSILALQAYPVGLDKYPDESAFGHIQQLIVGIRALRTNNNIPPNKKINVFINGFGEFGDAIHQAIPYVAKLTMSNQVVQMSTPLAQTDNVVQWQWSVGSVSIELDKVDNVAAIAKLKDDFAKANMELQLAQSKLSNAGFVAKAPPQLIQSEQDKILKYTEIVRKLQQSIESKCNQL